MTFLRHNLLSVVLVLCAGVIGTEVWLWRAAQDEARRALAALGQKLQERDWLARQSPAPSEESEQAIAAELAALRARIAALRRDLQPRPPEPLTAPVPARAMDAYFEMAGLIEQARARAITSRVTLRPDERFGFATYAHEGPGPDLLAPVHRQQLAVQQLLEPLFESRPLALLGVRREPPSGTAGTGRTGGEDFFTLDPGLSLRRAGLIETEALRIEFTGQTSTLRTFLGGLAQLRHPVVVRGVDVEPLATGGNPRPSSATGAPVPVVRQSLSKFAVTVEFVLLAAAPAQPAS